MGLAISTIVGCRKVWSCEYSRAWLQRFHRIFGLFWLPCFYTGLWPKVLTFM